MTRTMSYRPSNLYHNIYLFKGDYFFFSFVWHCELAYVLTYEGQKVGARSA